MASCFGNCAANPSSRISLWVWSGSQPIRHSWVDSSLGSTRGLSRWAEQIPANNPVTTRLCTTLADSSRVCSSTRFNETIGLLHDDVNDFRLKFQFGSSMFTRAGMNFNYTEKVQELRSRLSAFLDEHIYPNEATFFEQIREGDRWQPTQIVEELKPKARAAGLWNLFL